MGSKSLIMAFNARRTKRLQREIGTLLSSTGQEDNCGICVEIPDEGNMMHIKAYLQGPPDTPYESGLFLLDVNFPTDYPLMPPKINFTTRIWHPNISSVTGAICLDTLSTEWAPALSVYTCLLSIRSLLAAPEANDPQDAMVANQYINDFTNFVVTARYWTDEFAAKNPNYCKPRESTSSTSCIMLSRQLSNEAVIPTRSDSFMSINRFLVPTPSCKSSIDEGQPLKKEEQKTDEQRLLDFKNLHEKIISYKIPRTKALEVLTLQNWDLAKTLEQLNICDSPEPSRPVKKKRPQKSTKKRARPKSPTVQISNLDQPSSSSRSTPKPKKRARRIGLDQRFSRLNCSGLFFSLFKAFTHTSNKLV